MPASVTFTCLEGPLKGKQFAYAKRANFIVGRAEDCAIQIPRTEETMEVSRHHCLVELSPPLARIRDFGSLNGTYLNGQRIGARDPDNQPGEVSPDSPQHDLAHGDHIRLANVVLRVDIENPAVCEGCFQEIPEAEKGSCRIGENRYFCPACREKKQARERARLEQEKRREQANMPPAPAPAKPPDGKNPLALILYLMEQAKQGAPEVENIKGYTILKTLGQGGMGAVYLARRDATGQEVALKVMLPKVAANKDAAARFQREMDNAVALRHPNIVQSYESGFANNIFYLTMEVCDSGSVHDLIQRQGGKLPYDTAVDFLLQALDGLEYMHTAPVPHVKLADGRIGQGTGLVHRDLKPGNLFLNKDRGSGYTVKVADLGLAKAFDHAGLSGLTMTGQAAGSPQFMPRQQVVDYLRAKPEVDVWAVAATFYYMVSGRFPRDFVPGKDIWLTVLQSDAVPLLQRNPSVPKNVAKVIDQALVDKPSIGFPTISAFSRALRGVL